MKFGFKKQDTIEQLEIIGKEIIVKIRREKVQELKI